MAWLSVSERLTPTTAGQSNSETAGLLGISHTSLGFTKDGTKKKKKNIQ